MGEPDEGDIGEHWPDAANVHLRRVRSLVQLAHGRLRGWPGVKLPLGSRLNGARRIRIARGFRVVGAPWIEAVEHYAGERYSPSIVIGRDFRSSPGLHISAVNSIVIGPNCLAGTNVFIADHNHGTTGPERLGTAPADRALTRDGGVRIGANCWLGNNVVVVGRVTIGDDVIVGANSVVTRDLPARSIAVGAPARVIRITEPKRAPR